MSFLDQILNRPPANPLEDSWVGNKKAKEISSGVQTVIAASLARSGMTDEEIINVINPLKSAVIDAAYNSIGNTAKDRLLSKGNPQAFVLTTAGEDTFAELCVETKKPEPIRDALNKGLQFAYKQVDEIRKSEISESARRA